MTVTDTKGCSASAEVDISNPGICCFDPAPAAEGDIVKNQHNIDSSAQGSIASGSFVYIADNQTFTIDNTYALSGCQIVLGSNAQVVVECNAQLTLNGCNLHGCRYMWDGIYVNAGAILNVLDDPAAMPTPFPSKIQDAINGIVYTNGASTKMYVVNAKFYSNLERPEG